MRSRLRVVAGEVGGRRLLVPPGDLVRPTSDRVREAVFNALDSLGAVDGARALDLFAGSGALGIEALSRGAAHVTFVDDDRGAVAAVRANLDAVGLADRATVVASDALAHLGRGGPSVVDLALVDPPYAWGGWPALLAALAGRLSPDATVVAESDREVEAPSGLQVTRQRRYGGTVVAFLRPLAGGVAPSGDDR